MATANIEFFIGIPGLTLTVDIYPFGNDTASFSAVSLTEATNRLGLYSGTIDSPTVGMYQAFVKNGSANFAVGDIYLDNTTSIHRMVDQAASLVVQDATGTIPQNIIIKKNTDFDTFPIYMNAAKTPATGKTNITWTTGMAMVSKDGNPFENLTNLPVEVGYGLYYINLTASDLNANSATFKFTANGCDTKILSVITQQ